jgi:hypothetical protein
VSGELCRRCPMHGAGGGPGIGGPARRSVYDTAVAGGGFRVAVAAGSPRRLASADEPEDWSFPRRRTGDPSLDLDWQEALVALAGAVVERGGTLAVPASVEVAHLLALSVYGVVKAHGAEAAGTRAPIRVFETGWRDAGARQLLWPFVRRNVVSYHDSHGELVALDAFEPTGEYDGRYLDGADHHPLDGSVLDGATGVMVIHPDRTMVGDLYQLRDRGLSNLAVIGGTGLRPDLDDWAAHHDPLRDIWRPGDDHVDVSVGRRPGWGFEQPTPYRFLMEVLVERWRSQPEPPQRL